MWICASLLQKYVCSTCQHFKVQDLNQHTFWIEMNFSDLFLFTQILHCEDGVYKEGLQYKIIPGTESKGAYGEAAMCQDQNTSKTFMLKKVWHLVTMVSVISEGDPLCLRCNQYQLLSDRIWIPAKPSCWKRCDTLLPWYLWFVRETYCAWDVINYYLMGSEYQQNLLVEKGLTLGCQSYEFVSNSTALLLHEITELLHVGIWT